MYVAGGWLLPLGSLCSVRKACVGVVNFSACSAEFCTLTVGWKKAEVMSVHCAAESLTGWEGENNPQLLPAALDLGSGPSTAYSKPTDSLK